MRLLILIILCFILFASCQKKNITDDYLLMNVNIVDVENESVLENKHVTINADKITAIFDKKFSYSEEAIREVNRQIGQGIDFLKIYSFLSRESYFTIAEKSKEYGIPFAGHIPDSVSIWEAMEVNQQSAEHLFGLLEACSSRPEELSNFIGKDLFGFERANFLVETFQRTLFDSLAYSLSNSNIWLCPTLTVLRSLSNLDDTTLSKDPRLDYLPLSVQEGWKPNFSVEYHRVKEYYDSQRTKFNLQLSLIGPLANSGVKIIAGTDFPNPYCFPGFSLHDELTLLVEGGMSPAEALRTATINPAIFMGKKGVFGEVAEGQLSSLVLLDANPLMDIKNTQSIRAVFLRGKYLDRKALDSLLKSAKDISSTL